eukprot:196404_1
MASVFCKEFGLCFLTIIFSALCIFGAVVLFIEADDIYKWAKGFTIEGQCILERRTDEVGEANIVVEYYWNIYNISSCNKDEYLNIDGDDEIYSQHNVDFDTPDDEIYKYEIGHIEPCYTNDVCEYVVLDEKDGGGLLINQAGWKVFGGVVIILCSLILCGFALFCKCKQFKTWLDVRGNKHHNRRDSGSVARIDR